MPDGVVYNWVLKYYLISDIPDEQVSKISQNVRNPGGNNPKVSLL